jgi:hypothetical protein
MRMMHNPEYSPGKIMVFPNNRHGNYFMASFDCCELSPMRLGPVHHGQPDLPPSVNIENFHQGSKCYKEEMTPEGNPSALFYSNRLQFYNDPVPHRHKYVGTADKKNKNVPEFFVWVDKDGSEKRLTYVESRQFYCTFYERLASQTESYRRLAHDYKAGFSLEICGYDAVPISTGVDAAYMDSSVPFGHERVLAVMLTEAPENYPWRRHKTFDF